jgi:hypothetical protein
MKIKKNLKFYFNKIFKGTEQLMDKKSIQKKILKFK